MEIVRKQIEYINHADRKQISEFVESNGGTVFHETAFNIIASDIFDTKLTYYLAYKENELIGVCPCHTFKEKLLHFSFSNLSSYEIPYGGWIHNKSISDEKLIKYTKVKYNEALIYSSNIQIGETNFDCSGNMKPVRKQTVILNLSQSLDEIFKSGINHKLRNKILRAEKLGVTVEKINTDKINLFLNLSGELKTKTGMKQRGTGFYQKVMNEYEKKDKAVCLAAKFNNEYVSAMILLANKNFTIAWVAGRKIDLPNNLYQNELLWWESIKWAKNTGSSYLDLCGLDEINLPHLARIKLSFSKEIVPFYMITKKKLVFKILNKVQNNFSQNK